MSKNRFYMYTEYINFLRGMETEDQALLFRIILEYESGEEVEEMTPAVKAVFSMIKNRLDNNRDEYEKTCEIRRECGKKGGLAKASKSKQKVAKVSKPKQTVADNDNENDKENDKENEKDKGNNPPLSPHGGNTTATELIEARNMPSVLESAVKEWVKYKTERRQAYRPTGLKNLLTEIQNMADKHGDKAVIDVIHRTMSCNYAGIGWYWLEETRGRASPQYDGLAEFAKGVES